MVTVTLTALHRVADSFKKILTRQSCYISIGKQGPLKGSYKVMESFFGDGKIRIMLSGNHIDVSSVKIPAWSWDENPKQPDGLVSIMLPDNDTHILKIGPLRYLVEITCHP